MEFPSFRELHSFAGVYRIACIQSGYCYIGATTRASFAKRYTYHKNAMISGKIKSKMVNDFNSYGLDSFVFDVLFISNNHKEIAQKERDFIAYYQKIGKSYNKKSGGDFCEISDNTIKLISKSSSERGENIKFSEETKLKISKTLSSDHCSLAILNEEKVAEIKRRLINGDSLEELAEEYGVSPVTIKNIKYGRRWKYVDVNGWSDYCDKLPRAHVITEQQEKEIVALIKNGTTKNKIHFMYKVSYDKIYRIMKKYNI